MIGLHRDRDLADHRADLGARFPQRLAGFAGDADRQRFAVLLQLIAEALHHRQTRLEAQTCPGRECLTRCRDGLLDLLGSGSGALPQTCVGDGVGLGEECGLARLPRAVDEELLTHVECGGSRIRSGHGMPHRKGAPRERR